MKYLNEPILLTKDDLPFLKSKEARILLALRVLWFIKKEKAKVGYHEEDHEIHTQWVTLSEMSGNGASYCATTVRKWEANNLFVEQVTRHHPYWKIKLKKWDTKLSESNQRLVSATEAAYYSKFLTLTLAYSRSLGPGEVSLSDLSAAVGNCEPIIIQKLRSLHRCLKFNEDLKQIKHKKFL